MKYFMIFLLALLFIGCSSAETQSANTSTVNKHKAYTRYITKVGIVTEDTVLKTPYIITLDGQNNYIYEELNQEVSLKEHDLILVIDDNSNSYRATIAWGEPPSPIGIVSKDVISFDTALFEEANQAKLDQAVEYDDKDGNEIGIKSGVGKVKSREEGWILFELPGGGESFWVRDTSLSYDLDTSVLDLVYNNSP